MLEGLAERSEVLDLIGERPEDLGGVLGHVLYVNGIEINITFYSRV